MARIGRNAAIVVAVTAVVAGAALATIELVDSPDASSELDRFELSTTDLPAGYRQSRRVTPAAGCSAAFDRATIRRLRARRLVGCATVMFRRQEGTGDPRNLVYLLEYLFADTPGASAGLVQISDDARARAEDPNSASTRDLPAPALGDEAPRAMQIAFGRASMRYGSGFTYWWRRGRVVAVLAVANILRDGPDRRDALALARRIDERAAS